VPHLRNRGVLCASLAALTLGASLPAAAQVLPSHPLTLGGGRVTIGGDVSATMSCASVAGNGSACTDDTAFFNYTDYESSALRMLILGLNAAVKAHDRVWILGEVRSANGRAPQPYALYVRVAPWQAVSIQAGRVPTAFGGFARRVYAYDNLLIGYPLAYQYLTSLRPDALPASADELLRMRGRGWLSSFSVGSRTPDNGLPLVHALRWDTGVQLHTTTSRVDGTLAITTGTLAHPLVGDDNGGRQLTGRIVVRPIIGLAAGISAARGPFVTADAVRAAGVAGDGGEFTQSAWGADLEYSRGYYLIRFEAIVSDWRVPLVGAPAIQLPLRATALSVEGRYKIAPGLYAAARAERLGFSEITGSTRTAAWDAPVSRIEIGGGYSLQPNVTLKMAVQHNTRETTRNAAATAAAMQIVYWF
jgi:hypothetical protein